MTHSSAPSVGKSFIVKLYRILNVRYFLSQDNKYQNIITWNDDGYSILVKSIPEMMEKVLPAIYKHQNYSSFVRQVP